MIKKISNKKASLKSKKEASLLFKKGRLIKNYPYLIYYLSAPSEENTKLLISIPKKSFKKAVDRNKIKRQIREIYFNILRFSNVENHYYIAIVYIGETKYDFTTLKNRLKLALDKIK